MTLTPTWDRVVIKQHERLNNLYVPDDARSTLKRGTVVALGPNARRLKIGSDVFFCLPQYVTVDGEDYVIVQEENVLAVVEG